MISKRNYNAHISKNNFEMIGLVICMDLEEIKELLRIIKNSDLDLVEIKTNELCLKTQNNFKKATLSNIDTLKNIECGITDLISLGEENSNIEFIRAPIVGFFKIKDDNEISSSVKVGTKMKKGQIICYIEAMKMINEINCPYDAEILEILVDDERLVEYGQALLKIKIL